MYEGYTHENASKLASKIMYHSRFWHFNFVAIVIAPSFLSGGNNLDHGLAGKVVAKLQHLRCHRWERCRTWVLLRPLLWAGVGEQKSARVSPNGNSTAQIAMFPECTRHGAPGK